MFELPAGHDRAPARKPPELNRYTYTLNNPLKYVDPTGHAAADLQYLHPSWFSEQWRQGRQPVEYVNRYVTAARTYGVAPEEAMRNVTVAIGAGLEPSGDGLWNTTYSTDPSPVPGEDEWKFGPGATELRWGKVRIVFATGALLGTIAKALGVVSTRDLDRENAVTFAADLIVFTTKLDFNERFDRRSLMHELAHVMQAQLAESLGRDYLGDYLSGLGILMEAEAERFATQSGAYDIWPAPPPGALPEPIHYYYPQPVDWV